MDSLLDRSVGFPVHALNDQVGDQERGSGEGRPVAVVVDSATEEVAWSGQLGSTHGPEAGPGDAALACTVTRVVISPWRQEIRSRWSDDLVFQRPASGNAARPMPTLGTLSRGGLSCTGGHIGVGLLAAYPRNRTHRWISELLRVLISLTRCLKKEKSGFPKSDPRTWTRSLSTLIYVGTASLSWEPWADSTVLLPNTLSPRSKDCAFHMTNWTGTTFAINCTSSW